LEEMGTDCPAARGRKEGKKLKVEILHFYFCVFNFCGVSRITAWLTQASDRANSGRDKTVSVTDDWQLIIDK
jgi:hypothetical protein